MARQSGGGGGGRGRRGARGGRGGRAGAGAGAGAGGKKNNWKAKSEALRQAMMANRQYNKAVKEGKDPRDIPMPAAPAAEQVGMVPCPHCGRTFNEQAAERHIPRCKTTKARPKFLKRGTGGGAWKGK